MQNLFCTARGRLKRPDSNRLDGFTLVELMVVIAVLALLLALALPLLARVRAQGDGVKSLANIRSIGTSLDLYAATFHDSPPVAFAPRDEHWPVDAAQVVDVDGEPMRGFWFDHSFLYYMLMQPRLSPEVIFAPGAPELHASHDNPLEYPLFSDFRLSENFYADPYFWRSYRTQSPELLRAQKWSSVRFPAQKGLASQYAVHRHPLSKPHDSAAHSTRFESAVIWGDLSASLVKQGQLREGVPNTLDHYATSTNASDLAVPVIRTRDGLLGIDK